MGKFSDWFFKGRIEKKRIEEKRIEVLSKEYDDNKILKMAE